MYMTLQRSFPDLQSLNLPLTCYYEAPITEDLAMRYWNEAFSITGLTELVLELNSDEIVEDDLINKVLEYLLTGCPNLIDLAICISSNPDTSFFYIPELFERATWYSLRRLTIGENITALPTSFSATDLHDTSKIFAEFLSRHDRLERLYLKTTHQLCPHYCFPRDGLPELRSLMMDIRNSAYESYIYCDCPDSLLPKHIARNLESLCIIRAYDSQDPVHTIMPALRTLKEDAFSLSNLLHIVDRHPYLEKLSISMHRSECETDIFDPPQLQRPWDKEYFITILSRLKNLTHLFVRELFDDELEYLIDLIIEQIPSLRYIGFSPTATMSDSDAWYIFDRFENGELKWLVEESVQYSKEDIILRWGEFFSEIPA
ncbi:hypothetical protein M422DRAFT_53962 [Sphaerobolus stellatus SS14]|uniref:Unplaced genomic scaffold SPHSTscaffold_197, whole genome shotgun sequence n=1 Tax=Sphaerobolus stellatus (strain SS14) TaxID=990650 RepID=A0A0C9UT77_SPHS4|nr:hypothetical protein M422DRAFT_54552 [Sphaerobolus stellatus SS14]KIJ29934.1 hypothetical protein M422DRAFT_53962 [Sphaerobolus stellatus SS14]